MLPNVALTGKTGSGKSAVAEYLSNRYGYQRCSVGQIVRQITRLLYQSEAKSELNRVTDAIMGLDEALLMRAALASATDGVPIVFDSLRYRSEYEALRAASFLIWRVEASLGVRVLRLERRAQEYNVAEDEEHATEIELDQVRYDSMIANESDDVAELHGQIDSIVAAIMP